LIAMLALDIGSSSTRAALCNARGRRVDESMATERYAIRYTVNGGAELEPGELLESVHRCVGTRGKQPVAASAFWHGLLGLDRDGRPATPIYTWADSRSEPNAAQLRTELNERAVQRRTGCMLRAPFWPAKLRWLRRTDAARFRRAREWLSPSTWIFRQLFEQSATSHSMASGTGLYNLRTRDWDRELCELCGVRPDQLGDLSDEPNDHGIYAAIGDGAASNLGSGADQPGSVAINIGTSAAVRTLIDRQTALRLPFGLFRYVVDGERDVVGGAISNAGNLHQWCLRELQLDDTTAEHGLDRKAAAADALTVLPHLVRERAPNWPQTSGCMAGVTAATTAGDFYRAAITGSYYRLAAILDLLEDATVPVGKVIVSGGVLASPRLLAILADSLGRDLHVCRERESSLRGAALHVFSRGGMEFPRLPPGRIIRHRPQLATQHLERRRAHTAFERLLARVR
jgi:gluconokinase